LSAAIPNRLPAVVAETATAIQAEGRGVHGLRPMRYEKRVARNRFIALVIFLFVVLLCVISLFIHNH